jgi:hypothetical protein
MLWLAAAHPALFAIALLLSIVIAIALLTFLVKFLRVVVRRLSELFHGHMPDVHVQQNPHR